MPTMDDLMDLWRAAVRKVDLASAEQHEVQALIDLASDRPMSVEWHRRQAIALRYRTPENEERASRAWLVSMATDHLAMGTVPDPGSHRAAAIEQVMDELRDEAMLADRPSHETAVPEFDGK